MDAVHLQSNETKTEFIYFGGKQQLRKYQHKTININRETINRSTKVKYLRSHLDEELRFKQHVQRKCKGCSDQHMQDLKHQKILTKIL